MSNETVPKRRGRPPKPQSDRKDGNLTFRTRSGLRERLSASAESSGRSISEEIERRLEESYNNPCQNGRPIAVVLKSIASVIESVEVATGKTWQDDPITASLAGDLSREVIKTLLPPLPKIENRLLALTGRSGEDTSERGWDAAVTIARDEVLRQLGTVRDRHAAGLVETVTGAQAAAKTI